MKTVCYSLILFLWLNSRAPINCNQHFLQTEEKDVLKIFDLVSAELLSKITKFSKGGRGNQRTLQRNPIYSTISRQFSLPMMKKPKRNTLKRMFQISLLLLTIMAFGTFLMGAVMRNVRSNNRSQPTANKIVINMVRPATAPLNQQPSTDEAYT